MIESEKSRPRLSLYLSCMFVILLIYSCFFVLRNIQPQLLPGDAINPSANSYLLQDLSSDKDAVFEFQLPPDDEDWAIVIPHPIVLNLTINDHAVVSTDLSNAFSSYERIDVRDYKTSGSDYLIKLSEVPEGELRTQVFLVRGTFLTTLMDLAKLFHEIAFGMLLSLALCSFVLFVNKRSERYLLHSSLYFALLMFWIVVLKAATSPTFSSFFSATALFLNGCTFLLSIYIACELLSLPLQNWMKGFLSSPFLITGICLFTTLAFSFLPFGSFVSRAIFSLVSLAFGVYAFVKMRPENRVLTTLFFFTQLARANSTLFIGLDFSDSLLYTAFFTVPFFDLPYALGVLFVICKKFAQKFSDAEQLTIRLDERVAEKTHELQLRKEQQHQLMLNVFHDLRSPLFVMSNTIESLKKDRTGIDGLLPVMEERSGFMLSLITDLFLLAKLEINQVLYTFDAISLDSVIEDCVSAARLSAEERGVDFTCSYIRPCQVDGDKTRLTQVFDNLLDNAIAYADPDTMIKVSITEDHNDGTVSVIISNRGLGLSEDDLENVFEQYYRKNRTSTSASTGLGLSIARSIVEQHDGKITAASVPDVGTSFTVTLPLL